MKRKLFLLSLVLALALGILSACGPAKARQLESGDITEANVSQVCELLKGAGLSNTDAFESWVKDSAAGTSGNGSETSGFDDADCRMTVMLLAGDLIAYDSVVEDYRGSYLMFDMDVIENNDAYGMLGEKKQLLATMFGEMPISENGFAATLPENWGSHGIRVESDRCSIISILFKAYEQEEAFVGHTGILIDCRDDSAIDSDYVFVEKIAFGSPFTITLVKDEAELVELLSARPDYSVEEGEPAPVVYRNGEAIGELKP